MKKVLALVLALTMVLGMGSVALAEGNAQVFWYTMSDTYLASVRTALNALDEEALVRILREPKNSLLNQYKKLFDLDKVDLEFTEEALTAVAKKTLERKTGARGLRSILEDILMPLMYQVPSDYTIEKVVITKETVEDGAAPQITYNKERKPVKIKITQPKRRDRRDSVS